MVGWLVVIFGGKVGWFGFVLVYFFCDLVNNVRDLIV